MTGSDSRPPEWVSPGVDEQLWFHTRPSSNLVLGSLAVGFLLLIVMSLAVGFLTDELSTGQAISFVVLVLIVVLLVGSYGYIKTREYVLTSMRVICGVGFRNMRSSSIQVQDVQDIRLQQTDWQQLLNVGTLRFDTTDGDPLRFKHIENPTGVYQHVLRNVNPGEKKSG